MVIPFADLVTPDGHAKGRLARRCTAAAAAGLVCLVYARQGTLGKLCAAPMPVIIEDSAARPVQWEDACRETVADTAGASPGGRRLYRHTVGAQRQSPLNGAKARRKTASDEGLALLAASGELKWARSHSEPGAFSGGLARNVSRDASTPGHRHALSGATATTIRQEEEPKVLRPLPRTTL